MDEAGRPFELGAEMGNADRQRDEGRADSLDCEQILAGELAGWPEWEALLRVLHEEGDLEQARGESQCRAVLLSFDFLVLADCAPHLGAHLLSKPESFVAFLRAQVKSSKEVRLQVRPFNLIAGQFQQGLSPWRSAWSMSESCSGMLEIVGKVVALQNCQPSVWSRLVRCTNAFCEGRDPFKGDSAASRCPHCRSVLLEDCRARVIYQIKHIGVSIEDVSSSSGLCKNMILRLDVSLTKPALFSN